jgi:hypothetical protein
MWCVRCVLVVFLLRTHTVSQSIGLFLPTVCRSRATTHTDTHAHTHTHTHTHTHDQHTHTHTHMTHIHKHTCTHVYCWFNTHILAFVLCLVRSFASFAHTVAQSLLETYVFAFGLCSPFLLSVPFLCSPWPCAHTSAAPYGATPLKPGSSQPTRKCPPAACLHTMIRCQ